MPSAPWHPRTPKAVVRQFIAADLERGFRVVEFARTDHALPRWRTHLVSNAAQAHRDALRRLADAEGRGWEMADLRQGVRHLGEAVARLSDDWQQAA